MAEICRRVKAETAAPIWIWTGYVLEHLDERQKLPLQYCDYLIDGPFKEDLKDISLKWRGSSNQRILQRVPLGFFIDVTEDFG